MRLAVVSKDERKRATKERKKKDKADAKQSSSRPRTYVVDFKGDLKASAVVSLREEVSAILDVAKDDDEVVLCLENQGSSRRRAAHARCGRCLPRGAGIWSGHPGR